MSVAFERAIEGTIKRHTYHGEIVSEEHVYDNRLLMSLIGKLPDLFEPGAEAVERDWPEWMEAIELGLPEPVLSVVEGPPGPPAPVRSPAAMEPPPDEWTGDEVWEDPDGIWWTSFPPPPPSFDGEVGTDMTGYGYGGTLTPAEQAVIDAEVAAADAERLAEQTARRDRYFGFASDEVFPPKGCETYETSAEPPSDSGAIAGLGEPPAGGSAEAEAAGDSRAIGGLAERPDGGAAGKPNPSNDAALPRRQPDTLDATDKP